LSFSVSFSVLFGQMKKKLVMKRLLGMPKVLKSSYRSDLIQKQRFEDTRKLRLAQQN
jgi:hypothetical protein